MAKYENQRNDRSKVQSDKPYEDSGYEEPRKLEPRSIDPSSLEYSYVRPSIASLKAHYEHLQNPKGEMKTTTYQTLQKRKANEVRMDGEYTYADNVGRSRQPNEYPEGSSDQWPRDYLPPVPPIPMPVSPPPTEAQPQLTSSQGPAEVESNTNKKGAEEGYEEPATLTINNPGDSSVSPSIASLKTQYENLQKPTLEMNKNYQQLDKEKETEVGTDGGYMYADNMGVSRPTKDYLEPVSDLGSVDYQPPIAPTPPLIRTSPREAQPQLTTSKIQYLTHAPSVPPGDQNIAVQSDLDGEDKYDTIDEYDNIDDIKRSATVRKEDSSGTRKYKKSTTSSAAPILPLRNTTATPQDRRSQDRCCNKRLLVITVIVIAAAVAVVVVVPSVVISLRHKSSGNDVALSSVSSGTVTASTGVPVAEYSAIYFIESTNSAQSGTINTLINGTRVGSVSTGARYEQDLKVATDGYFLFFTSCDTYGYVWKSTYNPKVNVPEKIWTSPTANCTAVYLAVSDYTAQLFIGQETTEVVMINYYGRTLDKYVHQTSTTRVSGMAVDTAAQMVYFINKPFADDSSIWTLSFNATSFLGQTAEVLRGVNSGKVGDNPYSIVIDNGVAIYWLLASGEIRKMNLDSSTSQIIVINQISLYYSYYLAKKGDYFYYTRYTNVSEEFGKGGPGVFRALPTVGDVAYVGGDVQQIFKTEFPTGGLAVC